MTVRRPGADQEPVLPEPVWPRDVDPALRPDGLVAERPGGWWIRCGDPMWQSSDWVAMLDRLELSHDVVVEQVRGDVLHGRPVWRAPLRPQDAYDPRCPLLWSEVSDREECGAPREDYTYPESHDVVSTSRPG